MEPEGSLPHSQEPATFPYPEPNKSSPCHPIRLLEDPFSYESESSENLKFVIKNRNFAPLSCKLVSVLQTACRMACRWQHTADARTLSQYQYKDGCPLETCTREEQRSVIRFLRSQGVKPIEIH